MPPPGGLLRRALHAGSGPRPRQLLPGVAVAVLGVAVVASVAAVTGVPLLVLAVAGGALLANARLLPPSAAPGLELCAKRVLRVGVVLLGLRLSVAQVVRLGGPGLLLVAAVVTATFFGTRAVARRIGVSDGLGLLVAVGFAICGASAIAAVEAVSDAEEEEVAFAVALVTLCGSLSIVLLPVLRVPLGLELAAFGQFVGASVHDVTQVVATAAAAGPAALGPAVVVKLTRVVLLAPLVVLLGRRAGRAGPGPAGPGVGSGRAAPPLVPLFVAGFLAAVVVRSLGILPDGWLGPIARVEQLVLAVALFGLGAGVRVSRLRAIGARPLLLGLLSWVVVAATSYAGVRLLH